MGEKRKVNRGGGEMGREKKKRVIKVYKTSPGLQVF